MPIPETLMTTPVNVRAMIAQGSGLGPQADAVFVNLMAYARANWNYTASSPNGGEDLLDGSATSAPCGGIATALRLMYQDQLGIPADDIQYIRITTYVWTGPDYVCFDGNVVGNLRKLNDRDYRNGCIFNEHYYLYFRNKYYDPCLSTTYGVRDQSVKVQFGGRDKFNVGAGMGRKFLATPDRSTGIFYMPDERVAGFTGAYVMFDLTQRNVERALGKTLFRSEMAIRGGQTAFAQMVSALPRR